MKPLHAYHHDQSKASVGVAQNSHFYSFHHHASKEMSLWQKKKTAVFTLTLFIHQFKSDKQLLLMVKGSAINLGRPISRGSASGRASLLEVFNKWMLQMRNFKS